MSAINPEWVTAPYEISFIRTQPAHIGPQPNTPMPPRIEYADLANQSEQYRIALEYARQHDRMAIEHDPIRAIVENHPDAIEGRPWNPEDGMAIPPPDGMEQYAGVTQHYGPATPLPPNTTEQGRAIIGDRAYPVEVLTLRPVNVTERMRKLHQSHGAAKTPFDNMPF